MNEQQKFLEKLKGLVELAKTQKSQISIEEVKEYFTNEELSSEQMELPTK